MGEADLILLWIAGIVLTLLLWHASRIALGLNEYPAGWSPLANAISNVFGTGTTTEVLERVFVWAHLLLVLGFLAYLPHSKHLHIMTAAVNVWFGRTRARGRLEPLDFTVEDESAMRFGSNTIADMTWKQMVDTMSCTECGRCQDVCPAYATGKELSPKLLIMGLRDQLFAEGPNLLADRRLRADAARAERGQRRRRLGLRHLRRLRAGVPGRDRARRPHRRPAPPPRHGRGSLPRRRRDDAARRRALAEPLGQAAGGAGRLGRRARRAGAAAGRGAARGALLGRLRRVVRRARPDDGAVDGEAAAGGGRRLRRPRPARVVHRRPGPADGERVHLPVVRRAERGHDERGRRDEDRRELPALLQHARQRVPRLRRQLRGRPPHRAADASCSRRAASSRSRAARRSPTTTPATWPATTT